MTTVQAWLTNAGVFAAGYMTCWAMFEFVRERTRRTAVSLMVTVFGLCAVAAAIQAQLALTTYAEELRDTQCRQAVLWLAVIDQPRPPDAPPETEGQKELRESFRGLFTETIDDLDCNTREVLSNDD